MNSIINSNQAKQLILKAVEKAIDACATEHKANIDSPDDWSDPYKIQPSQVTILLKFNFDGSSVIAAHPTVDLTGVKND